MKRFITFLVGILMMANAYAAEQAYPFQDVSEMNLYLGQVRTLKAKDIERVAVGNDGVISASILDNGELMLIPKEAGKSELILWYPGNRRSSLTINVTALSLDQITKDVQSLTAGIKGIYVQKTQDRVLVRGKVTAKDAVKVAGILEGYPSVTVILENALFDEAKELLANIDGLVIKNVRGHTVLSGEITEDDRPKIEAVMSMFPGLVDLTEIAKVEMKKMIVIDVKILELRNSALEDLGINWETAMAGPTIGFTGYLTGNDFFKARNTTGVPTANTNFYSSIGITSELGSTINLMAETGIARYLSNPMLNTRSGETATFLAGGEIPYAVQDGFGQTSIEFKDYGVSLNIAPVANDNNEILTSIFAEVSAIDPSSSLDFGAPALLTRRTETVVNVASGETIVVSGLVSAEDATTYSKIPWLGDLPVLGSLFRSKSFTNRKSELVFLITPKIATKESLAERYEFAEREMTKYKEQGRPDSEMRLLD